METIAKLKFLIGFYLAVLFFLLLCVVSTPLIIRHGLSLSSKFIIEEETFESTLIIVLFGVSYFIWRAYRSSLKSYWRMADRAAKEKSTMVSRLAEAFAYIGTVNVEIQEIQSILSGFEHYPQTKKELKQILNHLGAKAMAVAGAPWIVVRIIDRFCGRTIKEYAIERKKGVLPSTTLGNRAILEGHAAEGLVTICSRQKNLDLMTACIFPGDHLSEEQHLLLTATTNQIEMFFLLERSGCMQQTSLTQFTEKEMCHDPNL